jgi:formylglycine-generating enzyme required for sulfatase activity
LTVSAVISSVARGNIPGGFISRGGVAAVVTTPPSPLLPPVNIIVRDRDVRIEIGAPSIRLSGVIAVDGGGPVPSFELEFLGVLPGNESDTAVLRGLARAGAAFSIDLQPGLYRVNPKGLPAGFSIRTITHGTNDLMNQPFQLAPGVSPEVALNLAVASPAPWARVSGKASGARTVALRGPALSAALNVPVGADGLFEFPKVLPGRYEARMLPSLTETVHVLEVGSAGLTNVVLNAVTAKDLALEFVLIEPGVFMMGCAQGSLQCGTSSTEQPAHRAAVLERFELGKFEVTQRQWEAVMGANPSASKGPTRPVDNVSWDDAQAFIARLNALDPDHRYRLPTETEWEYAARAGSSAPDPAPADSDAYGWFNTNAGGESHPVGQKLPNAWGLHDMRGNVLEWIEDDYDDPYYATGQFANLITANSGQPQHVLRGGSFAYHPGAAQTTSRSPMSVARNAPAGFRLARQRVKPEALKP